MTGAIHIRFPIAVANTIPVGDAPADSSFTTHPNRQLKICVLQFVPWPRLAQTVIATMAFASLVVAQGRGRIVEASSLLGGPLYRTEPDGDARRQMESQLAVARAARDRAPDDANAIIEVGRRLASLGQYRDAIATFSESIRTHPGDPRMYHNRGHRFLTLRRLPEAIRDLERGVQLATGGDDQPEPDARPNAPGTPTGTLQSNLWFHLGLARYFSGDFEGAARDHRQCLAAAKSPDMQVAASHWLYMALRRLGQDSAAARVLTPVRRDMGVVESGAYHRLLLFYRGDLPVDSLLTGGGGALTNVTTGYGVANWHLGNGRRDEAVALFRRILDARSQWPAFGYLAAEAEAKRLGLGAPR